MRRVLIISIPMLACSLALFLAAVSSAPPRRTTPAPPKTAFLGFDRNDYPGDAAVAVLRKTFDFTSYWLGPPPGEKQSTWLGKREFLRAQGFGFLPLVTAPPGRAINSASEAARTGEADGLRTARLARQEGFAPGTILFLDIEEGGRLSADYHRYLEAWVAGVAKAGFRAGIYCSAIPVSEPHGVRITAASDIEDHLGPGAVRFWVANDACPPSPGCSFAPADLRPAKSGFPAAVAWQYAQSPRRKQFTEQCPANYAPDGNCYAPGDSAHQWFLDGSVASRSDPSSAN